MLSKSKENADPSGLGVKEAPVPGQPLPEKSALPKMTEGCVAATEFMEKRTMNNDIRFFINHLAYLLLIAKVCQNDGGSFNLMACFFSQTDTAASLSQCWKPLENSAKYMNAIFCFYL